MKKVMLFGVVIVSFAMADEKTSKIDRYWSAENGGWVYVGTPAPEPTAEQRLDWEMRDALPFGDCGDIGIYYANQKRTLGQLSKMCDYVVVGKFMKGKETSNNGINLVLDVDAVLFGNPPIPSGRFFLSRKITITGELYLGAKSDVIMQEDVQAFANYKAKLLTPGNRLLVFLFSELRMGCTRPDEPNSVQYGWGEIKFDFYQKESRKHVGYYLARGNSGVKLLDTPENATNYLDAVTGYLKELRGGERDAESYYALLRRLVQSPVQHIREDARSDLMMLIQHGPPSFDPKRILTDGNIDEAIKYWVEHDIIPAREKKE